MAQYKKLSLAVAAATLFGANVAHAVDLQAGDWKLSIGGNVNGYLSTNSCDHTATKTVSLGLACQGTDSVGISNGLLPNELSVSASTRQDDLDVSATISLWPTIDTTAGGQTLGSNINARQGFFTFGDKSWGTVKIGRDLGIFGSDAILSDMTLLSVGVASSANNGTGYGPYGGASSAPTTLGRIGAGYLYADWIPQITYTSPNVNGFQVSAGLLQGLQGGTNLTGSKQPGIQAKVTYDITAAGVSSHLWGGLLSQQFSTPNNSTAPGYTASAYEVGGKFGISDFELVGYYYDGDGAGTTVLFLAGDDGLGNKRKSNGGYVQGTYKIGKLKLGVSYGESSLKSANSADETAMSTATATVAGTVSKNSSSIASAYYSLTKSITLVAEYINTKSDAHGGASAKQDTVAVGGIIFF